MVSHARRLLARAGDIDEPPTTPPPTGSKTLILLPLSYDQTMRASCSPCPRNQVCGRVLSTQDYEPTFPR